MEQYDVYLCAEGDNKIQFMLHVAETIKSLSSQKKIGCFSLELDFAKYQKVLDRFTEFSEQERIDSFGLIYGPSVMIAKKRGLDVIASDYRDTLADYIVKTLEAEAESLDESALLNLLSPLTINGRIEDDSVYKKFFRMVPPIDSLAQFFIEVNNEERERFTANFLSEYLRKNNKAVLHLGSQSRIIGVQNKLMSQGYGVKFL